jgi:hypothetical protein
LNRALLYCIAAVVTGVVLTLTPAAVVGQIAMRGQQPIPQCWYGESGRFLLSEDHDTRIREYSGGDLEALGVIFGMLLVGYVFFKRKTRDRDAIHAWSYSY